MSSTRVFLSYADRDRPLANEVATRMTLAGLQVWDYKDPDEALAIGSALRQALCEHVAACDLFVLIATPLAFASPNVRDEVHAALERAAELPIAMLVVAPAPAQPWPVPFNALVERVYQQIDPRAPESLSHAVRAVLRLVGLHEAPTVSSPRRLPLHRRLREELASATSSAPGHDAVLFSSSAQLYRLVDELSQLYAQRAYARALKTIQRIELLLEMDVPGLQPYYPLIVRGVCLLHCEQFTSAEQLFRELTQHARADESAWAGLGQAQRAQGDFAAAVRSFEIALALCRAAGRPTYEAIYNLTLAKHEAGDPQAWPDAETFVDIALDQAERAQVRYLRALLAFQRKEYATALTLIDLSDTATLETVLLYAQVLIGLGEDAAAIESLERAIAARGKELACDEAGGFEALHLLAHTLAAVGKLDEAVNLYVELLCRPGLSTWRLELEHARLLLHLGRRDAARKHCSALLSARNPISSEDFYWAGLASFICGESAVAERDFIRSADFGPPYAQFLAKDFEPQQPSPS